ncbi:hypothetical protein B0H12DRAFT_1232384 [Mycena haematopus]|nr:hypothetical protein B0H12DRAFT_1232384 [Mycena haematopus]
MAALYLHNSIWVPDAAETPLPHGRSTSSATLQTLQISDISHPGQPLLPTSESLAYLDLLSHQPNHPTAPRGSPMGLSLDGDPTTMRERKGYLEKTVRKRLRRLKVTMAVLEVIMVCWSLYTTIRYFLAFAIYPSRNGQVAAVILATIGLVSFAVLFAAAVIPFLQIYLLGHNVTITALLTVRMVLRYISSLLLVAPAAVNFALVFAWRRSSDSALNMGNRCDVDIDVVWSIRSHSTCSPPPWGAWLALAIVRLLLTIAILSIYHFSLASYQQTRRPSLHRASTFSESTYLGSPPMSVTPLPTSPPATSTINSGSRPTLDHRSPRSSRGSSSMHRPSTSPSSGDNLRLPRITDSPRSSNDSGLPEEFDPYANLTPSPGPTSTSAPGAPSESDQELYSFVDRFRSLVSQINRESEEASQLAPTQSAYLADPAFRAVVGYDEFGRPYPPDDHVRILNSYVRRMPTIESIGSREMTAGTSVAASSLYQEQRSSLHTLSRPPTRAMTDRDGFSEPPSRAGSLSLAAVELINAMGGVEGLPEHLGELVGRVRRAGSIGSTGSQSQSGGTGGTATTAGTNVSGASYFTASASPLHTPIVDSPLEGLPTPQLPEASSARSPPSPSPSRSLPPPPRALMHSPIAEEPPDTLPSPSPSLPPLPRALRPLPRPPGLARADSV